MKKPIFLLPIFVLLQICTYAQVGIGTSTPASSAQLDVSSTTKGFLPPRMTTAQKALIGTPASGLLVYQTDDTAGFYYYNGSAWNLISTGTAGVPYIGATGAVNLGAYDLTVHGLTVGMGAGSVATNTAIGLQALSSNACGASNTAIGLQALSSNTNAAFNTANVSNALYLNTIGNYNTAIGHYALLNAGGEYNTGIGYWTDMGSGNFSNTTTIGNGAFVWGSNNVRIGNTSVTSIGGQVG